MPVILQPIDDKIKWQKVLYQKIGGGQGSHHSQTRVIDRIISMAKVMHGLHTVRQHTHLFYFRLMLLPYFSF